MKSINSKFEKRQKIINLINQGISIPQISKQLQVQKSTIYYHYKKIKGRKYSLAKIPSNPKVLGEFLGAFAGDGSFVLVKKNWHYTIRFHLHRYDDKQYALYLQKLIEKHFSKKPEMYYVDPNALVLRLYSKRIYEFINEFLILKRKKSLNVALRKPIEGLSDDFLIYFVRGIMDTDGSVDKNWRIILGLISQKLIYQVSAILNKFGIKNNLSIRLRKPKWHDLYVLTINKNESEMYMQKIGFSNKRKEKRCADRESNSRS